MQIEQPDATLGSLRPHPDWASLDAKLWTALMSILRCDIARKVGLECDRAARRCELFGGRQVLWMISQDFKKDIDKAELQAMQDLQTLQCGAGISGLEKYLGRWH